MATTYRMFLKKNIDLSPWGLYIRMDAQPYFCTPKGAIIIGWTGVDGIHYCLIDGFHEMVFVISPMNAIGEYVHPIAKNFEDFLRLLLACNGVDALEQTWQWDQNQYHDFMEEQPAMALTNEITKSLHLTPIEDPYNYIKELQSKFDYSKIQFTDSYYECVGEEVEEPKIPEWKVYFNGDFCGHGKGERAGKEIPILKQFQWSGKEWYIPSIYTCSKGLVIDFLLKTSKEEIHDFMDKWHLGEDREYIHTQEQQTQIDQENPMTFDFQSSILCNHKSIRSSHGCGINWNPYNTKMASIEVKSVMQHYQLDADYGWTILRSCYPWQTKCKPNINSLSVCLIPRKVQVMGQHFVIHSPGEVVKFINPITECEHTLTVLEYEAQEMDTNCFKDNSMEYPKHYMAMSYSLTPDLLPETTVQVCDRIQGDQPRQKQQDMSKPQMSSCACVSIIGGADGPTQIFIAGSQKSKIHYAASSLHFSTHIEADWQMIFHEKKCSDITIDLYKESIKDDKY